MDIKISRDEDVITVALNDRLDTVTSPELQKAMDEIIGEGGKIEARLDMEDCYEYYLYQSI
jgi:anti-anti-sigma regulatory factor